MERVHLPINPSSANPAELSNTLKQFLGKLLTNCLGMFDHFVGLALKGFKAPKHLEKKWTCSNFSDNWFSQFGWNRNKSKWTHIYYSNLLKKEIVPDNGTKSSQSNQNDLRKRIFHGLKWSKTSNQMNF